ncbi:FCS-Like Zinc finger 5-like [Solanum dulcamara]|uniref:FCS-Like Zinc finger 5-like n=1 Tax=Solanum dulcamara TaxID=45834 RepID=UPI002486B919|nr:FCS-Like Zinc finger 5-like [Solanum dulcamara]
MMLRKRGRPPMRRTTSMTGITVDLGTASESEPSDCKPKNMADEIKGSPEKEGIIMGVYNSVSAMVSPRYQRRISGEGFDKERANFLRICGLCNRRLANGRDIYMYRGDTAFCSMECREQQMKQDEINDKSNNIKPIKKENHRNHSEFPSANPETPSNSDTIAAA